jgi:hypothetical protein
MAVKLTPKENFMRMINGEIPQSVPLYTMGMGGPGPGPRPPTQSIGPMLGPMADMMESGAPMGPPPGQDHQRVGRYHGGQRGRHGGYAPRAQ